MELSPGVEAAGVKLVSEHNQNSARRAKLLCEADPTVPTQTLILRV
jgi:hypothetical protein